MTEKKKRIMLMVLAVLFAVSAFLSPNTFAYTESENESTLRFDKKTPLEYTMEEYEMLTPQQQDEFFLWFDSIEAFETWMVEAAPPMPWEEANRNPAEYTWEEYAGLTHDQQEAFIASFETVEAFENWMEITCPEELVLIPWEQGGKMPSAYTWEEYEKLTSAQQEAFVAWFDNVGTFEAWMVAAEAEHNAAVAMPWEVSATKPSSYTWTEFEALTMNQKDRFIEWFDDISAFEAWLEDAQSAALGGSEDAIKPWEASDKTPDTYTWAEFAALTFAQQDAFVEWFDSPEAFEAWMETVNPSSHTGLVIPWTSGEKQPVDYAWEEYEALPVELQDAFFAWFESAELFEAWMKKVADPDVLRTFGIVVP